MKKLILLLICLNAFAVSAQDFDKISAAMGEGRSADLAAMFDSKVDVVIDGKDQILTKQDAQNTLKSFFAKHEPVSFKLVHKGVSQNDVRYMIGELKTTDGVYRATIYLHSSQDKYLIQSFELEAE